MLPLRWFVRGRRDDTLIYIDPSGSTIYCMRLDSLSFGSHHKRLWRIAVIEVDMKRKTKGTLA